MNSSTFIKTSDLSSSCLPEEFVSTCLFLGSCARTCPQWLTNQTVTLSVKQRIRESSVLDQADCFSNTQETPQHLLSLCSFYHGVLILFCSQWRFIVFIMRLTDQQRLNISGAAQINYFDLWKNLSSFFPPCWNEASHHSITVAAATDLKAKRSCQHYESLVSSLSLPHYMKQCKEGIL